MTDISILLFPDLHAKKSVILFIKGKTFKASDAVGWHPYTQAEYDHQN